MARSAVGPTRFGLLASAIAGRQVEVDAGDEGAPAWTDGTTIFVDAASDAGEQIETVAVQASILAAGSLDPAVLSSLARRPVVARRYLTVEGHRALALRRSVLPLPVCLLVDDAVAALSASADESLAIASGRAPLPDLPARFGILRPRLATHAGTRSADQDPPTTHIPRRPSDPALAEADDEDDGRSFDLFSSPVGGGGGLGRVLRKMFGEGRSSGTGPPGSDTPTRMSRLSRRASQSSALSRDVARIPDGVAPFAPRRFVYPEWDARRRRYRPAWCTVIETEPETEAGAALAVPDIHRLRRALAPLGTELERRHRELQGDDIDIDAAVEARVGVLAGSTPDEACYIDTVRRRRDLAVLILLDVSGSSALPSATGVPVHEHQRRAAAALCVALHELGDRVALYGFRSLGRGAVHVLPMKRFAGELDSLVLSRLNGASPGAYTRLGAAIRHGAAVLERDGGTARRLLVVLSDGLAYDHGYESAYGEEDARRSLAEARRQGIGCLCLSVGAGVDATALRRVFGTAAHTSIQRADHMPTVVAPLFRSALRSADLRRRAWQRRERTKERLFVERRTA
jgi:hypothetical protein